MRIGIFGGTFDPPHFGHLLLAEESARQLRLDRLLWVLTADPPHKQNTPVSTLHHRLAMTRLALKKQPRFELSRIEMDRPGPHFALDTVMLLATEFPKDEMVYLMGGDSLGELPTWHRPSDLVRACHEIGVMRRPGDCLDLPALEAVLPGLTTKVRFVNIPPVQISSSEIRQRIAQGKPYRKFLPPAVYRYIRIHRLYQA